MGCDNVVLKIRNNHGTYMSVSVRLKIKNYSGAHIITFLSPLSLSLSLPRHTRYNPAGRPEPAAPPPCPSTSAPTPSQQTRCVASPPPLPSSPRQPRPMPSSTPVPKQPSTLTSPRSSLPPRPVVVLACELVIPFSSSLGACLVEFQLINFALAACLRREEEWEFEGGS